MKKLAIGCGIVVLLFGVAGAGVTYYLYRQVSSVVTQFAEFAQVPELERSVRNRSAFTPPATGQITEQQIERLVRVQGSIRARLGERFAELEQRHKTLLAKNDATALDLPELFSLYRGLAATWMDGKRQQIEALNEAGFSLEEYRWVRERAYTALGLPFMEIDISAIMQDVQQGVTNLEPAALRGALGADGTDPNMSLVERFKKQLEDNLPLAALGL
jgi:hypothetical protein